MEQDRILVVGAGLAGLALARALRQTGFAPEVIERAAGWGTPEPACTYRPTASAPCGHWTWNRRWSPGRPRFPASGSWTTAGGRLADIDLHQLWGDLGPCLALPRSELHQILRDDVPIRLGRTVRSLERLDGPVGVTFDDGHSGEFDLVVGADGLRSTIRRPAGRRPGWAPG